MTALDLAKQILADPNASEDAKRLARLVVEEADRQPRPDGVILK